MNHAIQSLTTRVEPIIYAALRIVAGAMMSFHGIQKIIGWQSGGFSPAVGSQLWFGGLIELVAGALAALGLFTRTAAFLLSGTMAVAYIQFHWKLAFTGALWIPALNKGELAALYCFVFLLIAARGSGVAALDRIALRAPTPQALGRVEAAE
jgi:putative oxidoreductase